MVVLDVLRNFMNFSLLCRTFVGFVTGTGLQVHIDSGEMRAILSIQEKCYFYPIGWVIYLGKGSALPMCHEEQQMPSSVAAPYHKGVSTSNYNNNKNGLF